LSSFDLNDPSTHQRWRLDLAYDGTSTHGFADQLNLPTVVGLLRDALQRSLHLSDRPLIVGAGRTDSGVHAIGQVAHVDLPSPLYEAGDDPEKLRRQLNGQLSGIVQVRAITPVTDEFHARFSATWRRYRYLVVESSAPALATTAQWAWTVQAELDPHLLQATADLFVGEHDFRSFCKRAAGTTADDPLIRRVFGARWTEVTDSLQLVGSDSRLWRFEIAANAFCHNMVRVLTASCVAVARGQRTLAEIETRLTEFSRDGLPAPAPAAGLTFVAVGYGDLEPDLSAGHSSP